MSRILVLAAVALAASACGASDSEGAHASPPDAPTSAAPEEATPSSATTPKAVDAERAIRTAAKAYSDAFLSGNGRAAYALLSARCQERNPESEFVDLVATAGATYGEAQDFATFAADVNGEQARVTYTYASSPEINQTDEPWVLEDGAWHEDDC